MIFENDIVRLALNDRSETKAEYQLLDEIVYLEVFHNEILRQIINDGILIGDKEYIFFTATTGQVRKGIVTLIRKDFYEKHKGALMVGLTVEGINAGGGMNVGKFLAYNALSLSSSVRPEKEIDIDRCVVVDGLETIVTDAVKYIDIQMDEQGQCYVADTPKEYQIKDIPIEHTDGAGMFLPGELPSSCQIRGGYIKGAMFPFDFKAFCHEIAHSTKLKDAWGQVHDIEEEDIRFIFTTSQLKMYKCFDSWDEYKAAFKENHLYLSINSYANAAKDEVSFSYQFLQTLPYDIEIDALTEPAIEDLRKLKTDIEYTKDKLGLTLDDDDSNVEKNNYYIAKALQIYPALIEDEHIKNKIEALFRERKKSYMGGKIPVKGYYSYVAPDLYAFCEYLFMGVQDPQGLIPKNCVYNKHYDELGGIDEVVCLRSPHLSRYEYPRRKLLHHIECKKWFSYMENDTVVSCHDLISKSLQCDWDGDEILISPDEKLQQAAALLPDVPLYYDMQKAQPQQINNDSLFKTLVAGFENNVIGISSNAITKLWNRPEMEEDPMQYDDLVNVICAYSNYAIDFPKTGKALMLGKYEESYRELTETGKAFELQKVQYPQFFKYAKKKKSNLEGYTNSPMDRICQHIDKEVGSKRYKYIAAGEKFEYRMLMNNTVDENGVPVYEIRRSDRRYEELLKFLSQKKEAKQNLSKRIQEKVSKRNTDTTDVTVPYDVLHYHFVQEVKRIFTDKGGRFNVDLAVNYMVDMEYKTDFLSTSKDILWRCFGHIIVDNLNRNKQTGITLKERPRKSYKKLLDPVEEIDTMLQDGLKRKSVDITQSDIDFMDAVLQKKSNGSYYQNDVELLFALLCHYKYSAESGRLKNGMFELKKNKHVNGKTKKNSYGYNVNTIMKMVDATSYVGSFKRFREKEDYVQIVEDNKKFSVCLNLEKSDNILFVVRDIYNPMVYLLAYYKNKQLSECVICGKHFIKNRNAKTCSKRCSDKYHKICVDENNKK